jgi:prophage antirepressor-like protein
MNNSIVLRKEDFTEKEGVLYMPIRELARRLGYKEPRKLKKLYLRHKDELEEYAVVSNVDTPGGKQESLIFSELGCYTISMFAETENAKPFRKALAHLLMELRKGNIAIMSPEAQRELDGYKMRYFELKREDYTRKKKGLNFTKTKALDRMLSDGVSQENISKYLDIEPNTIINYIRLDRATKHLISEFRRKYPHDWFYQSIWDSQILEKQYLEAGNEKQLG